MPKMKRLLDSRAALALGTWIVYTLAIIPLYRLAGPLVLAMATIPVIVTGWLFGTWAGVLASSLALPLNMLLLILAGEASWGVMIRALPGSAILVLVGVVVGRLRDLGEQVKRELTERKRAEEALRESEERYRQIVEKAVDVVYTTNVQGFFTYVNPAAQELTGYLTDELAGMHFTELIPADWRERAQSFYQKQFRERDRETTLEFPIITRTGEKKWVEQTVKLLAEGDRVTGFQSIVRDITERVRAEEALKESEERYRDLFENANDLIQSVAPDGSFVYVNRAWREILGYDEEEIAGLSMVDIIHPDNLAHCMEIFQRVMSGKRAGKVEAVFVTKDGKKVTVEGNADCRFVDGKPIYTRGIFRDITERKRAEEQSQRYAADLEQANEEVKQFAYIVSHDLRAPLVNLKGFAAELRLGLEVIDSAMETALPHLDEKQRQDVIMALEEDVPEALGFINSSATHMDHFISALLKLSRLGRRELRLEPVDMDALVQATLESLAHQIEERQVEVTVGPLPEVVADRTSMEQIMGNLLGNAVKYLDPDCPGRIGIIAQRGPGKTTFHIRDNGRGIAEDDMDKVFAPFRRIGRQDVPGEGMGLPYVQALVRRHGGRTWYESELGAGMTFTFTIPNHQ